MKQVIANRNMKKNTTVGAMPPSESERTSPSRSMDSPVSSPMMVSKSA